MKTLHTPGAEWTELSHNESASLSGGVGWLLPILTGAALVQIFTHWDHFKEGLAGKPESAAD